MDIVPNFVQRFEFQRFFLRRILLGLVCLFFLLDRFLLLVACVFSFFWLFCVRIGFVLFIVGVLGIDIWQGQFVFGVEPFVGDFIFFVVRGDFFFANFVADLVHQFFHMSHDVFDGNTVWQFKSWIGSQQALSTQEIDRLQPCLVFGEIFA